MLSFECIKNEKSVYFLLTSARGLGFGQLAPTSPRLLPKTSSRQTTAEQVLAHSRLKTAAINQQVHLPTTKKSPYGLFFANSFYIRRS